MPYTNYSGAVPRSIPDLMGDYPSILAWGALGDGVTDDTAAFATAFAASSSTSGTDVVYIPANRIFLVSGLTLSRSGFRLVGAQGQDTSTNLGRIKLKNGSNATVLTVSGANCRIEGVNIDGNAANQTVAHPAVEITANGVTLESSLIQASKGDGIKLTSCDSVRLQDNTVTGNSLFGINLSSATKALITDNSLATNTSGPLTTSGTCTFQCNGNNGLTDRTDYQLLTSGTLAEIANDTGTGTTVNRLCSFTSTGKAIITSSGATSGAIGVVQSGAGTSGNCDVALHGPNIMVDFDGATTADDYVQISATTAGKVHDAGATFPTSGGQVIGRVLSTNGSAGTYAIFLYPAEVQASGGGGGGLSVRAPYLYDGTIYYNSGEPAVVIAIPPGASSLAWINQGGASLTTGTYGDENILIPASDSQLRIRAKNIPVASTWTATGSILIETLGYNGAGGIFNLAGLIFVDTAAATPDVVFVGGASGSAVSVWHQAGYTVASLPTSVATAVGFFYYTIFAKVHYDGTSLIVSISTNGTNYTQVATFLCSTYFPTTGKPTKVGWAACNGGAAIESYFVALSFNAA